jgi:PhoH-like ATPase
MKKNYVLDTNVLIHTPHALESFEDNRIVLPLAVLQELDGLKNSEGERGYNARESIRILERFRQKGNLIDGVSLPGGGELKLETNHVDVDLPAGMKTDLPDNRILQVCKGMQNEGQPVILVTKDIVVRIKAQTMGIPVEDFTTDQTPVEEARYTGRMEVFAPDMFFPTFKKKGMPVDVLYTVDTKNERSCIECIENEFFIIRSDCNDKHQVLGRVENGTVVPLRNENKRPFGIKPRNIGQLFLQEALMLDAECVPLVIVKGPAGTAKTFYSMAVGLERVLIHTGGEYRKILVCRSNSQFDADIGFLPGSEQEKISPLLRPVRDNLESLMQQDGKTSKQNEDDIANRIDGLFNSGIIAAEAMNFMRGRSITNTWLVIDEAQNLTPRQVKGIITRVGSGTKVILLGDTAQIDNPMIDERTNGLSYAAVHMRGSPLCIQLTMAADECERSPLALDACRRM